MSEADYYAPGSYNDPNAPWNEPVIPERDFDVCVSQTLSKNTFITTQDYYPEYDEEDGSTHANTEDTDWKQAYKDCAMTPLDIIMAAKELAKHLMEQGQKKVGCLYLKDYIEECDGWIEDECEVVEE